MSRKKVTKKKENKMNQTVETVSINGIVYVKQGSQPVVLVGPRVVLVNGSVTHNNRRRRG